MEENDIKHVAYKISSKNGGMQYVSILHLKTPSLKILVSQFQFLSNIYTFSTIFGVACCLPNSCL